MTDIIIECNYLRIYCVTIVIISELAYQMTLLERNPQEGYNVLPFRRKSILLDQNYITRNNSKFMADRINFQLI